VPRPASGSPDHTVDYVIIAGAAGLRWDDVNPTDTPPLWKLADDGSIGALSVRTARRPTCPGDGWLTLGAGNYAPRTGGRTEGGRGVQHRYRPAAARRPGAGPRVRPRAPHLGQYRPPRVRPAHRPGADHADHARPVGALQAVPGRGDGVGERPAYAARRGRTQP